MPTPITRSRRWFLGAAATAAATPMLASAQIERPSGSSRGTTTNQSPPASSYTSPTLGMQVTWTDQWSEYERSEENSFATMQEESITLSPNGISGFVGIYGIYPTRDAPTAAGMLDFYENLAEQKLSGGPETAVVLHERWASSFTALFLVEGGGGPMFELWELRVPPASQYATYVLTVCTAADFEQMFNMVQQGITFNAGAPYVALADTAILTSASQATTGQATSQTTTDPASGASYASPVFGMQVTWAAPWEQDDVNENADKGYERITLRPSSSIDYISLTTSQISANHASATEYLDHYQEAYQPAKIEPLRDSIDGVHFLIQDRTGTSVTVFLHYRHRSTSSPVFEIYEHRVQPGTDFATSSIMVVSSGEVFPGHFRGVQSLVTLNGGMPYITVDTENVAMLATNALNGQFANQTTTSQTNTQTDTTQSTGQTTQTDTSSLVAVRQHFEQLRPTVDELFTLLNTESLTDPQIDRISAIVGMWIDAPGIASRTSLPPEFSNIQSAYVAYAENLATAGTAFVTLISSDSTESQKDAAGSSLETALNADAGLASTLDSLLTAAGA